MKKISYYAFIALFFLYAAKGRAQSIGINDDGSTPNSNAILDIKSFTKGMLVPRMSTTNRLAIPATKGMLVYDTTTSSFWYNTGIAWQNMSAAAGSGWSLTGNSGIGNTGYLGTNDFTPLRIRVNGQPSGIIDPTQGNSFWGYNTGAFISQTQGNSNTAMGHFAMQINTTGNNNTAHGAYVLSHNSTGINNTVVGSNAGYNNTNGSDNTAIGYLSMQFNTSGSHNTAVGQGSLNKNTIALYNSAFGNYAMYNNTTGEYNAAVGAFALAANTTGMHNTVMGYSSMDANTNGEFTTVVGALAGRTNVSGQGITLVGASTDVFSDNLFNATAIGHWAMVEESNKVRIGNSAVTVIEGQVPFTTPSDARFKYGIQEDVKGLDFLLKLRPVTYQFNVKEFDAQLRSGKKDAAAGANSFMDAAYTEAASIRRSGFIAQEVEHAATATGYNFSGVIKPKTEKDHYGLSYESFVVPIVKGIQELNAKLTALEKENAQLKNEVKQLQQRIK